MLWKMLLMCIAVEISSLEVLRIREQKHDSFLPVIQKVRGHCVEDNNLVQRKKGRVFYIFKGEVPYYT